MAQDDFKAAADCAARAGLELVRDARRSVLAGDGMEFVADFSAMRPRIKPGRLQGELLVRAARIKGADHPVTVFDATAGLGEDSFLLAAAGFDVVLCEADPVIAALLRDALRRAAGDPELASITARMRLIEGDSIALLNTYAAGAEEVGAAAATVGSATALGVEAAALPQIDVVYLDPMFPERRKSAAVKKKFQLLHRLERPCENQEELLAAALASRPRKVVIKRPAKGPDLAGAKPAYRIAGKAVRYDVVVPS